MEALNASFLLLLIGDTLLQLAMEQIAKFQYFFTFFYFFFLHVRLFKYYYCIPVQIHGIHYHTQEIQFRQINVSCPHSLGGDGFKHTQKRRPYSEGDGQCIMLL